MFCFQSDFLNRSYTPPIAVTNDRGDQLDAEQNKGLHEENEKLKNEIKTLKNKVNKLSAVAQIGKHSNCLEESSENVPKESSSNKKNKKNGHAKMNGNNQKALDINGN